MPVPTRPAHIAIGDRRRPRPAGQPGYLRVDTVHPTARAEPERQAAGLQPSMEAVVEPGT